MAGMNRGECGNKVLLSMCKNIERSTAKACLLPMQEKRHKRGYISVACSSGHQWVWCPLCCVCPLREGEKGCNVSRHWFERDSFDTGKRNHMQRHQSELQPHAQDEQVTLCKRQHDSSFEAPAAKHRRWDATSASSGLPRRESTSWDAPAHSTRKDSVSGPVCTKSSPPPCGNGPIVSGSRTPSPTAKNFGLQSLLSSEEGLASQPSWNKNNAVPSCASCRACSASTSSNLALMSEIQIINACKHVERKNKAAACQCPLSIKLHTHGYLTVRCSAGHQYVWCSCCCDCRNGQGIGCLNALHWSEHDYFDSGKRNHIQSHYPEYDATQDEDRSLISSLFPRQVLMPRKMRSTSSSTKSRKLKHRNKDVTSMTKACNAHTGGNTMDAPRGQNNKNLVEPHTDTLLSPQLVLPRLSDILGMPAWSASMSLPPMATLPSFPLAGSSESSEKICANKSPSPSVPSSSLDALAQAALVVLRPIAVMARP